MSDRAAIVVLFLTWAAYITAAAIFADHGHPLAAIALVVAAAIVVGPLAGRVGSYLGKKR